MARIRLWSALTLEILALGGMACTKTETATWDTVTGKPGTFSPSTHSHPWNEVTGAPDFALTTSVTAMTGRVSAVEGRVAALETSSGTSSPLMMSSKPDDNSLMGAGYSMVGTGRPESYSARTNMPSVHSHVINAAVLGAKVYVAGGYIANSQSTPLLREYDLVTDKWTARQQLATARHGHVLIGARGKVYAIGGSSTVGHRTTEIYDPQLNAWTTGASLPDHNHYAAAYGILPDGKLHVVGGHDHATNKPSPTHVVYDFDTDTWNTARDMPVARYWPRPDSLSGVIEPRR